MKTTIQMKTYTNRLRPFAAALIAVLALLGASRASATVRDGNPFTPAGADYTIYARQGIDSTTPNGKTSGFSPQVNQDFEFQNTIGVSYDTGGGTLKDFGVGLYAANGVTQSTGLNVQYNAPVDAYSVTITLADFDIKAGDTFFKTLKVEPSILIFGPGGTTYASASPADIFKNLTPAGGAGKNGSDTWNLNFGALLKTLGKPDAPISGFLLYADAHGGERVPSDPYFLVAIGNGVPMVPEAGNYVVGLAAMLFGGLFQVRQTRLKRKALNS